MNDRTMWNYRILAHEDQTDHGKEIYFILHEVYYSPNKEPRNYMNKTSVSGADLKAVKWALKKMKKALKKPILWADGKFPAKYKP